MRAIALLLAASLVSATPALAEQVDPVIGHIKAANGTASIERSGSTLPAQPGTALHRADLLTTGADGSLGLMLVDETRLSLGPGSRLSLEKFAFNPEAEDYSLVTRMTRGTLLMVSGLVAKLSPESARVETPSGIIGVRGTKFLVRVQE